MLNDPQDFEATGSVELKTDPVTIQGTQAHRAWVAENAETAAAVEAAQAKAKAQAEAKAKEHAE